MKGFGPFLIGFALAVGLSALSIWAYEAGQLDVAERASSSDVILHDEEG